MMKMMKPSMATRGGTSTISLSSISNSATGKNEYLEPPVACSGDGSAIGRESPAKKLRGLLESPGIHLGPACFDALSAKLIERSGFDFCFTTGFVSYGEMVDQGRQIAQAVSIPIIGDGDNGYGNAMNVKRTVKGYISAGFAGIILEDQSGYANQIDAFVLWIIFCQYEITSPAVWMSGAKVSLGKDLAGLEALQEKVVSREEAVMKIKAAVDARKESGSDIVIVARTDSRQAVCLEESIWRSRAFH
ncbi:phosphoenolpyruvate carboxylase family protein [Actinidia rufa]|uniref:Phosphoenolpyruvate carboxylase family protein n=1 Tax=Actinidia rufa TaxID=165716 RepID=A0A7J0E503_9ERIC|nr:phosphoenolpyruvate carboxylase family protein [Actinidia rufa]